MRKKISAWIMALAGIFFLFLLLSDPKGAFSAAEDGLLLYAETLLPSLLPFLMAGQLIVQSGLMSFLARPGKGWMEKGFRLPGEVFPVLILSLLSGYPAGAKMLGEMQEQISLSFNQRLRAACLCSHAGPAFIVGTLGAVMLGNITCGWMLWGCHLLGSLLTGIVFSFIFDRRRSEISRSIYPSKQKSFDLSTIFSNLVQALSSIACLTVFFAAAIYFIGKLPVIRGCWMGILELTHGCSQIMQNENETEKALILLSFYLGFGGLSVWLQTICFLPGLHVFPWCIFKCTQGLACAALMKLWLKIFPWEAATFAQTASKEIRTTISPYWSLAVSMVCMGIYILFVVLNQGKAARRDGFQAHG